MINEEEIIPILLKASPAFGKVLAECEDKDLIYVVLGDFARHMLELHKAGQVEVLKSVAEAIERFELNGDNYVREATTIGLLEGIQNVWGNDNVNPELFRSFLLPESLRWWDELNAFWRGERRCVGEGLARKLDADEVAKIREEVRKRFQY
jgi:hypothetical protein